MFSMCPEEGRLLEEGRLFKGGLLIQDIRYITLQVMEFKLKVLFFKAYLWLHFDVYSPYYESFI